MLNVRNRRKKKIKKNLDGSYNRLESHLIMVYALPVDVWRKNTVLRRLLLTDGSHPYKDIPYESGEITRRRREEEEERDNDVSYVLPSSLQTSFEDVDAILDELKLLIAKDEINTNKENVPFPMTINLRNHYWRCHRNQFNCSYHHQRDQLREGFGIIIIVIILSIVVGTIISNKSSHLTKGR